MGTIHILIADDHEIVRDGLSAVLENVNDIAIDGEASNGEEVLDYCKNHAQDLPEVILMDLDMPKVNGIEACRTIKMEYPDIKVLALTMLHDKQKIRDFIRAGGNGYIFKNSGMEELLKAVRTVNQEKPFFSDEAAYTILSDTETARKSESHFADTEITKREQEVLELICREFTNPEIADKLYISVRTVDTHRRHLLQKTGARNTAGLVRYAIDHNVVEL